MYDNTHKFLNIINFKKINKGKWKNSWDSSLCLEAVVDQQKKTIVSQVIHVAAVALVARRQDHGLHPSLGAADHLASWTAGVSPGNACKTIEQFLFRWTWPTI